MTSKASYVRSQPQTRDHTCHWPDCPKQVPPAMWGCRPHWFRLPKAIRNAIWAAYRPGQEKDMRPSHAYLEAATSAQRWIAQQLNAAGAADGGFHEEEVQEAKDEVIEGPPAADRASGGSASFQHALFGPMNTPPLDPDDGDRRGHRAPRPQEFRR